MLVPGFQTGWATKHQPFLPPCQAAKSTLAWWPCPVLRNNKTNYQAQQCFETMHWSVKNRVRISLFQTDFDLSHPQNLIYCYSGDFPLTQALFWFFLIKALLPLIRLWTTVRTASDSTSKLNPGRSGTQHLGRWKSQGKTLSYILVLQKDFPWSAAAHARICKLS